MFEAPPPFIEYPITIADHSHAIFHKIESIRYAQNTKSFNHEIKKLFPNRIRLHPSTIPISQPIKELEPIIFVTPKQHSDYVFHVLEQIPYEPNTKLYRKKTLILFPSIKEKK